MITIILNASDEAKREAIRRGFHERTVPIRYGKGRRNVRNKQNILSAFDKPPVIADADDADDFDWKWMQDQLRCEPKSKLKIPA